MSPRSERSVRVSGGFCLLVLWFAVVNGWELLAIVLGAAAIHELGHYLVLRSLGAGIKGLRLSVFGAVLETDSTRMSYLGELAAVLAGPAANLLCVLLLAPMGGRWTVFLGANLVLCMFNLLPVRPLDGGKALGLLVSWAAGPAAGEWAVRWIGASAAAAACGFCRRRGGCWRQRVWNAAEKRRFCKNPAGKMKITLAIAWGLWYPIRATKGGPLSCTRFDCANVPWKAA